MPGPNLKRRKPITRRKKKKTTSFSLKRCVPYISAAFVLAGKGLVLMMIWGGVVAAGFVAYYAYDLPDITQVAQPLRRPAITLLANDGTVFKRYGDLSGHYVTKDQVPQHLVDAILAIEDRRFYSHFGIDVFGLSRAFYNNFKAGRVVQGGSTITQQLAKNLFLTPQRTTRRKVQEMLLSFWLERTYTKDQILTAYLNRVYLGAGTYGVDAAANVYFGKPVGVLNLRESAILAGLLRAPSRYAPTNNPARAMQRARVVLTAMIAAGYISEEQRQAALNNTPMPRSKPGAGGDGQYFADWIVEQVNGLLENTPQDLVILTTLDLELQRTAERTLDGVLATHGEKRNAHQAALVSMAYDGAVQSMAGGRDYGQSQFNRVTQAQRQTGSAFKPIVYLAALRQGLAPHAVYNDGPIRVGKWSPKNYNDKYMGDVTLRQSLAYSLNTVAVRVMQTAGVPSVVATARDLGVTSALGRDLSMALGSSTMTPLELTGVYAAFATGGRAVTPYGIREIRNREGKVLFRREPVTLPVTVEPQAVASLVGMLQDVVTYGTGRAAALDRPVAGKTGTSSDYRDAWFMGFTGNYITGVWVGNDDNRPMDKVTGGNLPALLWKDYMSVAESTLPAVALLKEAPVQVLARPELYDEPPIQKVDSLGAFINNLLGGDRTLQVDHSYPEQTP